MPKKKLRSVAFTFHMEGQDDRAVSVKLADSGEKGILTLSCRLAGMNVTLSECPLALRLFSIAARVGQMDKIRDKECAKAEKEAQKKFGKSVAAVGTNVA